MDEQETKVEATGAGEGGEARPWLSSVTVGDFPGLEDDVTIELSPKCTVLVGRNGAGKSLILDALLGASAYVRWEYDGVKTEIPGLFKCTGRDLSIGDIEYEYERNLVPDEEDRDMVTMELSEACWQRRGDERAELWRVEDGLLHYANGEQVRLGPEVGRLSQGNWSNDAPLAEEALTLSHLLRFRIVHAGVPREGGGHHRRDLLVRVSRFPSHQKSGKRQPPKVSKLPDRTGAITSDLVFLYELSKSVLESPEHGSFEAIARGAERIGLASELKVDSYGPVPSREKQNGGGTEEWVDEVKLDGVNLGRASDGTCRVLETLLRLFEEHPGWRPPLLLEEPETGIHPALLLRLLHELEAYEGQIIISTHSPQVVSWAKPEDIRLVERRQGKTTIRALAAAEVERVHEYLAHDGTLGEFVYGGALDDEI